MECLICITTKENVVNNFNSKYKTNTNKLSLTDISLIPLQWGLLVRKFYAWESNKCLTSHRKPLFLNLSQCFILVFQRNAVSHLFIFGTEKALKYTFVDYMP